MWTDRELKQLSAQSKTYRVSEDSRERGVGRLVLEVKPNGFKYFFYKYFSSFTGKKTFVSIGRYRQTSNSDGFTLSEARAKRAEYAELLKQGIDVKQHLKEQLGRAQEEQYALEKQGSLEDLVEGYVEDMRTRGKRTSDRVFKAIELYVFKPFPNLKSTPANEVSIRDIKAILGRMAKMGIKAQTNKVRAHLHAIFQYGLRHDHDYEVDDRSTRFHLEFNPVAATKRKSHFDQIGQHVQSRGDIRKLWRFSNQELGAIPEATIKLAYTTGGQRPGELLRCPWECYDLKNKLLTIPADVSKNSRVHMVPLNELAMNVLESLQPLTGHLSYPLAGQVKGDYVDQPMRPDSLSKAVFRFCEKHQGHKDKESNIEKFIPRDIRRTCKTLMGAAGLSKEIRDRIQNHALHSDVSSIHYDRYDYLPEKREAMKIWNQYLELIIRPKHNVIHIRKS